MYCIGNGQAQQTYLQEQVGTLNCMHDQQAVILRGVRNSLENYFDDYLRKENQKNARTQNKILCLLLKTYGTKAVVEWGIGVLDALQQTKVLQPRVHERSFESQTENRNELYGRTLTRPSVVAEWLLRDMRERQECRRSPQGRKLSEQQFGELTTVVPELPHERTSRCKQMFDLWGKGQGLWLLQQTLYQIQEIWRSFNEIWKERNDMSESEYVVRRLSPLECERLQGFPDGWTDIPGASDTARYKALGNSIALPQWQIIIDNMAKYLPDGATLGSLFDGISGFPLCWERTHGKGTARWSSEIEKFPIEVCKYHFGDEETGQEGDIEKHLDRPQF